VGKVVFVKSWQPIFAESGLKLFEDFFDYSGGQRIGKNNKREVITFHLGRAEAKKQFFMKRFFNPHLKDMLFTLRNFGRFCSQAACEWKNANILLQNNIDTYKPICYGERINYGLEKKSFFLTEKLPGSCLTNFVADNWSQLTQQRKEKIIVSLAKLIRRVHNARISLPDLYVWHIFITEKPNGEYDFAIIDLHRMKQNVTNKNQQIRNLARLHHSMRDKYFDDKIKQLFIESYAADNWPSDVGSLVAKIKSHSKKISTRRNPKEY